MITVLQANIQSWRKNRYLFEISLPNHNNPDVILLNEVGQFNTIKLSGYNVLQKDLLWKSGVAILIKKCFTYVELPVNEENFLAIKLMTNYGPIIITTAHTAPRISNIL